MSKLLGITGALALLGAMSAVAAPLGSGESPQESRIPTDLRTWVRVVVIPLADGEATQRPTAVEFLMSGGDWADQLQWASWGGDRARATGVYHVMLCKPDCASGHAVRHPGRVELSARRRCGTRRYYTRAVAWYEVGGMWRRAKNLGQPAVPC